MLQQRQTGTVLIEAVFPIEARSLKQAQGVWAICENRSSRVQPHYGL